MDTTHPLHREIKRTFMTNSLVIWPIDNRTPGRTSRNCVENEPSVWADWCEIYVKDVASPPKQRSSLSCKGQRASDEAERVAANRLEPKDKLLKLCFANFGRASMQRPTKRPNEHTIYKKMIKKHPNAVGFLVCING